MTGFVERLPHMDQINVDDVISMAVNLAQNPLPVASIESKKYCADLSHSLLTSPETQKFAELQALGFWLRPASIERIINAHLGDICDHSFDQADIGSEVHKHQYRAPAGIVLQLPPSNVEALFGYTTTISLLCGNVTMARLSSSNKPAQVALARAMTDSMQRAAPCLKDRLFLLRYDHNDEITGKLSSVCDARLVWGSDETVDHIRNIALPPLARHISFGDRFSSAAIDAQSYLLAPDGKKQQLIQQFYNDVYWFDQLACSSPRLLMWIGNNDNSAKAADDFFSRLGAYASSRNYLPDAGESIAKLNVAFLALHDLDVLSYKIHTPALSVVELNSFVNFNDFKNVSFGYGLLLSARLDTLADLAHIAQRCDQTLTLWGFDIASVQNFVGLCRGRGYDRLVPVGQALAFAPAWDGYNMFDLMTRSIQVEI